MMILLSDLGYSQISILVPLKSSTTGKYKEDTMINTNKCIETSYLHFVKYHIISVG